jgi:hypothetical protein
MSATKMIVKKRKKRAARCPKKESVFKVLVEVLDSAGVAVRREKLKRGDGWRVASGQCRFREGKFVFVDQRMSQDDQIALLASYVRSMNINVDRSRLALLPPALFEPA